MKVYGFSSSGNCHKVRLLLNQVNRPFTWIETDNSKGETHTAAYLAKNPNGKVPMLEREDGTVLVESNAILYWLAKNSAYFPQDDWEGAQTLSWMFFEQYSHEPYVAVARFISGWLPLDHQRRVQLPSIREKAHAALKVMDKHLAKHDWFSGSNYGIADIALFAYTHVAPDGGVFLDDYAAISQWLSRVQNTPRFLAMPRPDAAALALISES